MMKQLAQEESIMELRMLKAGLLVFLIFLLAGCSAAVESVEPSAVDDAGVVEEYSGETQSLEPSNAVPMPETNDEIIAGEDEVIVEAPLTVEGNLLPPDGEVIAEEINGADSEVMATDNEMKKVDISSREGRIAYARQELAANLDIPLEDVMLKSYEQKVWPDGNFGCRPKGKRFTPAEVQGYIIYLSVGNEFYTYHGGAGRLPFQCSDAPADKPTNKGIILPPDK